MAIRKRHGANGLAYQVYWKNPFTGRQQCKTFGSLAEARKHDSLIRHKLKFEQDDLRPSAVMRDGEKRTLEDAVFLFLKDKRFPDVNTKKFLVAVRRPLELFGHIRLADIDREAWENITRQLRSSPKARGEGLLSDAFVHGILSKLRAVIRWTHSRGMPEVLPPLPSPSPRPITTKRSHLIRKRWSCCSRCHLPTSSG